MKKVAIVTSHPIQYNAPLFRLLHSRAKVAAKVFYTWGQTEEGFVYDPDFKRSFKWDIPLLDGYEKEFVENVAANPGAGHFSGIKNKDLIERIDRYNPDALLVFGWSFNSHLKVLRHYSGKKTIIFRGDSTLLDEPARFSFRKFARRIFLQWVYRHVDHALYTGADNEAYYLKHGLKAKQLHAAPHAIENERFYDEEGVLQTKALLWRKELGILTNETVFLFAGKLEPKKDPQLLLNAFEAVTGSRARLLFVGNGILEQELKAAAAKDPRVLFLDFQNQQMMPVVYRLGNVFVLPSKGPGETWGLSVNEAMASGRPVLVSNKCGCAKDLINGNGHVFQAGNCKELTQLLQRYVAEEGLAEQQSLLSKKNIRHFSIEQIAAAIESIV